MYYLYITLLYWQWPNPQVITKQFNVYHIYYIPPIPPHLINNIQITNYTYYRVCLHSMPLHTGSASYHHVILVCNKWEWHIFIFSSKIHTSIYVSTGINTHQWTHITLQDIQNNLFFDHIYLSSSLSPIPANDCLQFITM